MTVRVSIQHTGLSFAVEEGESVLTAALRQQIDLPWGCGTGICGTCMGQVISGEVCYPNGVPLALFESDAEQGKALFCMGHPVTDLVVFIPELS